MAPTPPALPPNWQRVDDPGGNSYYWNTVTQAVSWTQPEWPTPGGPAPPGPLPPPRRGPPGAVGADARTQVINDPVYMGIVNKNAANMRTLQRGLSNLDIAVSMPPTTAVPSAPYANPRGFANLPPPSGGYSAPPPSANPPPPGGGAPRGGPPSGGPPPGGGPPPSRGPQPGGSGGGGGDGGGGGGSRGSGERKANPTAMQHRLRAIPYYARNVALITNTVMVWLGVIMLFSPEYLNGVEDALPDAQHGDSALLRSSSRSRFPFKKLSRLLRAAPWVERKAVASSMPTRGCGSAVVTACSHRFHRL